MIRPCALQKKLWNFYHYGARNCLWYFEFFFFTFHHASKILSSFRPVLLLYFVFNVLVVTGRLQAHFTVKNSASLIHIKPRIPLITYASVIYYCREFRLLSISTSHTMRQHKFILRFQFRRSIRILIKFIATAILAHDRQRQGRRDQIV